MPSPTQRTLKALRARGCQAEVVERWLAHVHRGGGAMGVRRDLFGWIDIVALEPGRGIGGVQSTGQDFSGHLRKLQRERGPQVRAWLQAGGWAELWGWRKLRGIWTPRVLSLALEDFDPLWD